MANLTTQQIETLAKQVRNGLATFEELYAELRKTEWIRFKVEAAQKYIDKDTAQALFDDAVMNVFADFQTTFIGLLRITLGNRLKNAIRSEIRQRRTEQEHVEKYLAFTANPMLVRGHEVEFELFLGTIDPVLQQACKLLDEGLSMKATSQQLGFKDMRTLKSKLQKAFAQFIDGR